VNFWGRFTSVVTLELGCNFNHPLSSDIIPNSVKEIFLFKMCYTLRIPDSFLNRITYK
jgi:hypothetical protein